MPRPHSRGAQPLVPLLSRRAFVRAMAKANVSCSELAKLVGCSKQNIGHLRTGQNESCAAPLAEAITTALGHYADGPLFGEPQARAS